MAFKLADVFVPITGDDSALRKTLAGTQRLLKNFVGNLAQGISQGIGQAIFQNIQKLLGSIIDLAKQSVHAASDLNESLSKTQVAFGASAKTILDWSKTSATALGQSRQQALEAASSFGLLFSTMGVGSDVSAEMSIRLVELATDMASINNIPIEDALLKLRSGLVGEAEPLRTVGVLLNETVVAQEALREGLAATKEGLTDQDKVMARYNLILQQTAKTQGDFARTSQGIANQERILAAQREDALARIGAAFAPIYLVILQSLNKIINQMAPNGENIIRALAEGMVNGVIFILPALRTIKDVITYWLAPGSPPNLLPDLVKWGASAMNFFLAGFSDADFGALESLGSTIEGILRSFVTSGAIAENDIVQRVFGSKQAIAAAVAQWSQAGQVTQSSIEAIQNAAGPAGVSLAGLVQSFFDMEGASKRAAAAQRELTDVTEQYDRALDPLNKQLGEINDKQDAIRDKQAISAARKVIRDPAATANAKRLAQLDIEKIKVENQIGNVEKERDTAVDAAQQKLKAAQKEEEVAKAVYNAQAALLQQTVETNRLIGEQNDLRKKQSDDAERLYQATLAYNLVLADTPGKLALLRLELARQQEGTVGYYDILTQIAQTEKQLKSEADAGAIVPADGVLPGLDDVDVPKWAKDLSERLRQAIEKEFPSDKPIFPSLLGGTDFLNKPIGPEVKPADPVVEVDTNVKMFVDTLKELTKAIEGLVGPAQFLAEMFGLPADNAELAAGKTKTASDDIVLAVVNAGKGVDNSFNGKWREAFGNLRSIVGQGLIAIANQLPGADGSEPKDTNSPIHGLQLMGQAFSALMLSGMVLGQAPLIINYLAFLQWIRDQLPGSEPADPSSPLFGLGDAGAAILDMVWEGLKLKWIEVSAWWTEKMQWIRDMLPFSEPANPSSPLTGLQDAGKAILHQIQLGFDSSTLTLPTPNVPTLAAGAASVAGGSSRSVVMESGAIQVNGVAGAEQLIPSLEDAFKQFLQELANA